MTEAEQIEELKAEIAWLRSELGLAHEATELMKLHTAFRLAKAEGVLVLALYRAKSMLSKEQLIDRVPVVSRSGDWDTQVVAVHVCRIRKKIGKDTIQNQFGVGYWMTAVGKARIKAALET